MSKARLRIHDISRPNHQAAVDSLTDALTHCRDHDVDGAIVILSSRSGRQPIIRTAGKLTRADKAVLELFKLQMTMTIENASG